MVGETEHELTSQKIPYEVGIARYREIARGQILGDDSGFFKMLFHREDRRLLWRAHHRNRSDGTPAHRPDRARPGSRARLLHGNGVQPTPRSPSVTKWRR